MKQLPKETELEKFSPSIHAAHLLKPKKNNQKKHAIAKLASYCVFPNSPFHSHKRPSTLVALLPELKGFRKMGKLLNCAQVKRFLLIGTLLVTAHTMPAMVRTEARELVPTASKRAINLARGAATASNGGLRIYHPARCMYLNPTNNPCLTKRDAGGYEFRFQGGPPGWEVIGIPPSVNSIVLIAPDGRSVIAESHEKIKEVSLPALP